MKKEDKVRFRENLRKDAANHRIVAEMLSKAAEAEIPDECEYVDMTLEYSEQGKPHSPALHFGKSTADRTTRLL